MANMYSQTILTGKLVNQDKKPIEFAEVILSTNENKMVNNQLSDVNGVFSFSVPNGNYTLKVNQVNNEIYSSKIELSAAVDLGEITIIEKTNQLNEVSIVAKKKLVERKVDRLVFNVENSIGVLVAMLLTL